MKTTTDNSHRFEFSYPMLDTLVLVEENESEVVIRATRDTFTPERKAAFLRELVMEGFVSEKYRWANVSNELGSFHVRWLIDYSWLEIGEEVLKRSRRLMVRLFVSSSLGWLAMIVGLFLFSGR